MNESPETPRTKAGRSGGFLGGITGMLLWFNQPEDLLNIGVVAEWLVLATFVGVCILVGTMMGRLFSQS